MKQAIQSLLEKIRTSIWPIPTVITLACLLMSRLAVQLDELEPVRRFVAKNMSMSTTSVENIMTTIAGSVISVGGITFSMTMVAMTLASAQFGPKVLREYLNSRPAKITLGLFLGTFVYNIVALISFKTTVGPGLYLLIGVFLAIIALFMFVHFIHTTALSIQADRIVHHVGSQLELALAKFVSDSKHDCDTNCIEQWNKDITGTHFQEIKIAESGYVESINYSALTSLAEKHDCFIDIHARAGKFILNNLTIGKIYNAPKEITPQSICAHIRLGVVRTPVQDPEFAISQINQIAARALSPGINDPGTAITCVDWFSAALAHIVDSDFPDYCFTDTHDKLRVVGHPVDFSGLFSAIWVPLRQHARSSLPVCLRILESLDALASLTDRKDRLCWMISYAKDIEQNALMAAHCTTDKADIQTRMSPLIAKSPSVNY